ncbi:MAG: FliI/YscN family ATPase [Deltaproteobacteria bacterium]|nr:FliI/YscN family ATPase [Deltaproteobacteria bacterium]
MTLGIEGEDLGDRLRRLSALEVHGSVVGVAGPVVRCRGVACVVGQQADLWPSGGLSPIPAEVIGIDGRDVLLMALGPLDGVGPGCAVGTRGRDALVPVGEGLLGRVVDGLGRPLDGRPLPALTDRRPLRGEIVPPLDRARIRMPFSTGIRVIDAMPTVGLGQRIGVFAGAGVGKSTFLSMIARNSDADVCVVGLIGERGREVREFVEDSITDANRARTVTVAVTGDEAPLARIRGALLATTITEFFRARGAKVLLLLDSLTRFAMALRETGLAAGEIPASKGYPPSVFAEIARLLERAGCDDEGCTTAVYTVLVEGDDMSDPVADATRALLDGHVCLSRDMANRGLLPAVDVLASSSRLMPQVVAPEHLAAARQIMALLAAHRQAEDLIRIGAYQPGSDPVVDRARKLLPVFEKFQQQALGDAASLPHAVDAMFDLARQGAAPGRGLKGDS